MRTEIINGRKLVCGHILNASELKVGQQWSPADGSDRVVVIRALEPYGKAGEVAVLYGEHGNDRTYDKDSFSFQCRYCLIDG